MPSVAVVKYSVRSRIARKSTPAAKPQPSKLLSFAGALMRLLRLHDVEIGPNDRVFRHSRTLGLILWLVEIAGMLASFYYAYTAKFFIGYFFGVLLLLFVLGTKRYVTARFHPSNWLVRMNDAGMYIQYRSYLNYELPPDDPSVVFLSFGEIASAHLLKERVEVPDPAKPGQTSTQFLRYVELEIPGNTAPLVSALSNELGESAPMKKTWYGGSSSTLYQDYPVTMSTPPFLRIRWDVVPRAKAFLEALRPYTVISDTVSLTHDFAHMQSLSREAQQEQLRELASRGQTVNAIYTARKLYGCSLEEAKEMVDSLRMNKVS
jgi:hypothetical protein